VVGAGDEDLARDLARDLADYDRAFGLADSTGDQEID
jgi:hypothetical protein